MRFFDQHGVRNICIDAFADCNYQEDGAVDFMLLENEWVKSVGDWLFDKSSKDDEYYNAYATVAYDKSLVDFEFVKANNDGLTADVNCYTVEGKEAEYVIDQLDREARGCFKHSLDELLAEAKEYSKEIGGNE